MNIVEVAARTADVDRAAAFHADVLGLPVDRVGRDAVVTVGASRLRLRPGGSGDAVHHLAFDIPHDAFASAKAWLADRVPLLTRDGADEFEGPAHWHSRSVYFDGPDGAVLELIARRELDNATGRPFTVTDVLSISEVGVGVDDPPAVVDLLAGAGLAAYGDPAPDFAPVGDAHGLLIVARTGRAWLPTADRSAGPAELTVRVTGAAAAEHRLSPAATLLIG